MPLMVVAGAAGADSATVGFTGTLSGKRITAFHFGSLPIHVARPAEPG
jgi:hypothetical protein